MPKSRQTLTRRVSEIGNFIQTEVYKGVRESPCWGIQIDESTDKADHAQMIVYAFQLNTLPYCVLKGTPMLKTCLRH